MQNLGLSSTAVQRFSLYLEGLSRTCSNPGPWSPGTEQYIQHLSVYSMDTVLMKAAILIGSCLFGQKHAHLETYGKLLRSSCCVRKS